MDKENVVYILYVYIRYYSAVKKTEILPFVTTQMDLEGNMLSEISQTEKDRYSVMSHICGIKLIETDSRMKVARG